MCSHGQSLPEFVAELRESSEKGKFGDQLEHMLRDHLVCEVADPVNTEDIPSRKNLTV